MDERELVEIEGRSHTLSRRHRQDVLNLLLAIRSLKAAGEGKQVVSRAELLMIIKGYERKMNNLRRDLARVIEKQPEGLRRELTRIAEGFGSF